MTADLMTTYTDIERAEQCAQEGLTWLKEVGPEHGLDWTRIEVSTFDVGSLFRCALAQASPGRYPNYNDTLYRIGDERGISYSELGRWAGEKGFNGRYASVAQLNIAWIKLLRKHRPWWKKPLTWIGR